MGEIRNEFPWLDAESTTVVTGLDGESVWWTFAGHRANATLANELSRVLQRRVTHDSFALTLGDDVPVETIERALRDLGEADVSEMHPAVDEQALEGLKFSACLPHDLAIWVLQSRLRDDEAVGRTACRPHRFVKL
jgi:ATP-dependent Lhr-like helicase